MRPVQLKLFSYVFNSHLFSNHWLENRLELEPEYQEQRQPALNALVRLVKLWKEEENRLAKYGDEQGLEYAFIQPALEILGWKLKYQTFLDGREPDYALFLTASELDAALDAGRKASAFWHTASVVADAKAWNVSLDRPHRVRNQKEYPPQQIEWYLDRSRCDFGILTNARTWRLVPRIRQPYQPRFQTFLQFNLVEFLAEYAKSGRLETDPMVEEFLQFYLFFGTVGFQEIEQRPPLVRRATEGSSEYKLSVGEGLKDRTFEALRLTIEGFLRYPANELNPSDNLELCRRQGFIFLYRLLFIMYAEDRQLLPYRTNSLYTKNRSLGRLRNEVAKVLDSQRQAASSTLGVNTCETYEYLIELFDLVDGGHKRYGVPAYNGGLFDNEAHPFLERNRISDWYLTRVIDRLGRAHDAERPAAGLFRVDFRDLAIQHLGGIYEGLLELYPRVAEGPMVVAQRRVKGRFVEKVVPADAKLPSGYKATDLRYPEGAVYLETDKGERRASGSYYTPDHIVNYIVEETLGPMCTDISKKLEAEIRAIAEGEPDEAVLETLRSDFDDRVLRLRVLDPAMGSGHFLIAAGQYLAEEISTHPYAGDASLPTDDDAESVLTFWKRRIAEQCLFGVDLNPLAVELAKLALWLDTVSVDHPLTFLDHHLRKGNSVVGGRVGSLGTLPQEGSLLGYAFGEQVKKKLDLIATPLARIRELPSDSVEDIKEKEALFRKFARARAPFLQVADLWCSQFALTPAEKTTPTDYQKAVGLLYRPNLFKRLRDEEWFSQGIAVAERPDMGFFHWQLEFPEVFLEGAGIREYGGFDAIVGNPPYDVLAEKETGHDLSALRAYIDADPTLAASVKGKNNLYKLFVCRSVELLANGGRLGFIVPMPLLGDDQAVEVRKYLMADGVFCSVDAFPQKDNPKKRVFPEAKLSTVVFTYEKNASEESRERKFRSRRHPARKIDPSSPSLLLSPREIPLYDPENVTIVACAQEDWDFAIRLMQSGRLVRLGNVCESYQGEVNETTDGKKGVLSASEDTGPQVLRGSNVCMYGLRKASQGEEVFLDEERYHSTRGIRSKARHTREQRLGFQRSSPQNNFRRLIAARVPPRSYCFDTISYVPESESKLPLGFLAALLNSDLADWYFRLGSTNSKVNEYQFKNLPCPRFAISLSQKDHKLKATANEALMVGNLDGLEELLLPLTHTAPFSQVLVEIIASLAAIVESRELERGDVARTERSHLAPQSQPYQDLIDRVLFAMSGLSDVEVKALKSRLSVML